MVTVKNLPTKMMTHRKATGLPTPFNFVTIIKGLCTYKKRVLQVALNISTLNGP